jgi:hypothetical protein
MNMREREPTKQRIVIPEVTVHQLIYHCLFWYKFQNIRLGGRWPSREWKACGL